MLTLEQIRAALADRNLSIVARATDLGYQTVYAVAKKTKTTHSYRVIKRLNDYLTSTPGGDNGKS